MFLMAFIYLPLIYLLFPPSQDILLYQALRDKELARREDEDAARDRAKKEQQAKLLAQQEKAQNNAGEWVLCVLLCVCV